MNLTSQLMLKALSALETKLPRPVRLIMGGGGAMLLAHHFTLSTTDIDAIPATGVSITELEPLIQQVAQELGLSGDWLNPYYSSFTHVLPPDYGSRLIDVCTLPKLTVSALSKDDLLIMKCFAARQKDVIHARALVKKGANIPFVRKRIEELFKKGILGSEKAERFLKEIEDFLADKED